MTSISEDLNSSIGRWEVQLRKGVLEFVILLSLRQREQYGFELIEGIAERALLELPEGTLYPLLLRLAKEGLVSSRFAEGGGGAPRKYYALTDQGQEQLEAMTPSWSRIASSVDRMLTGVTA